MVRIRRMTSLVRTTLHLRKLVASVERDDEHGALVHPRVARETDILVARPVILRPHHIPDATTLVGINDEACGAAARHVAESDRHLGIGHHVRSPVTRSRARDERDLLADDSEPQLGRAFLARSTADRDDVAAFAIDEGIEPAHAQPTADLFDERSGGAVRSATMIPRTRINSSEESPTN